jgi:hypothetical protein
VRVDGLANWLHSNLVFEDIGWLTKMEIVILKLLKVLILLSVSSLLLQVCLKCKLNWLLSLIPVQSCRFLIQLLCWEHTQVLGVSSEVPFLLSLSHTHFFFAWNSSFT